MKKISIIGIIALSILSCKESQPPTTFYSGTQKEAIIDNILTRRSIRKYTDKQVSQEMIDTIMRCAIMAPSALNKQPWEMRVVQNTDILNEINQRFINYSQGKSLQGSAARYNEPGFSIFHGSPTLIVIAGDKNSNMAKMDIGIAMQNILLSAHSLGLGTCPLGTLAGFLNRPENEDILKLLNIPDDYETSICISLGYPDESPEAPIRYPEKVKIIK